MQISHRAGLFELELIVEELREKVRVTLSGNLTAKGQCQLRRGGQYVLFEGLAQLWSSRAR